VSGAVKKGCQKVLSSTDAEKACLFALCNSPIAKKNLKGTVWLRLKKAEIHSAETEYRKKELTKELQDLVDQTGGEYWEISLLSVNCLESEQYQRRLNIGVSFTSSKIQMNKKLKISVV
jgi:hypothetical protein